MKEDKEEEKEGEEEGSISLKKMTGERNKAPEVVVISRRWWGRVFLALGGMAISVSAIIIPLNNSRARTGRRTLVAAASEGEKRRGFSFSYSTLSEKGRVLTTLLTLSWINCDVQRAALCRPSTALRPLGYLTHSALPVYHSPGHTRYNLGATHGAISHFIVLLLPQRCFPALDRQWLTSAEHSPARSNNLRPITLLVSRAAHLVRLTCWTHTMSSGVKIGPAARDGVRCRPAKRC